MLHDDNDFHILYYLQLKHNRVFIQYYEGIQVGICLVDEHHEEFDRIWESLQDRNFVFIVLFCTSSHNKEVKYGKEFMKHIFHYYKDKIIVLDSLDSSLGFYEKLGFVTLPLPNLDTNRLKIDDRETRLLNGGKKVKNVKTKRSKTKRSNALPATLLGLAVGFGLGGPRGAAIGAASGYAIKRLSNHESLFGGKKKSVNKKM